MDIKNRLLAYIKHKNVPVKHFEEKSGLSNGYVSSMRKGLGSEKLESVLRAFPDLNRDWLLYGEGDMLKSATPQIEGVAEMISMPYRVWKVIEDQAASLKAKDNQVEEVVALLKEQIKRGEDADAQGHAARRAARG